jgi:pilus assembly protein Flp/PilA
MNLVHRLIKDESGATAIEYGLIAGLVAVAIIAALTALGGSLDTLFTSVSNEVDAAASGSGS